MRLAPLDNPTPDQQAFADHLMASRGRIVGPFRCLVHGPKLGRPIEALASSIGSAALPEKWRELALLIAARFWDAQDQWLSHVDKARAAGLSDAAIDALAAKQPLDLARQDERIFYSFCKELLEVHFVSDATYAATLELLGEEALVDAVGCLGTFTALALYLNAFAVEPKPGLPPPFPDIRGFTREGARKPLG